MAKMVQAEAETRGENLEDPYPVPLHLTLE